MKDRQVLTKVGNGYIPVVSPTLHVVSMTGLVFLRSSFGYVFLRPKALLLAAVYAQVLFSIYAWNEPGAWEDFSSEVIFGLGASFLYGLHLAVTVIREMRKTGKHDQYSGTSHILRLVNQPRGDEWALPVHLSVEPAILIALAVLIAWELKQTLLSYWLVLVAFSLGMKEGINYWYRLRTLKRHTDVFSDAEDRINYPGITPMPVPTGKSARKKRIKRDRTGEASDSVALQTRYAKILRMMPPYSSDQANKNYHVLIMEYHPDVTTNSEKGTARAAELNEAVKYFRHQSPE